MERPSSFQNTYTPLRPWRHCVAWLASVIRFQSPNTDQQVCKLFCLLVCRWQTLRQNQNRPIKNATITVTSNFNRVKKTTILCWIKWKKFAVVCQPLKTRDFFVVITVFILISEQGKSNAPLGNMTFAWEMSVFSVCYCIKQIDSILLWVCSDIDHRRLDVKMYSALHLLY